MNNLTNFLKIDEVDSDSSLTDDQWRYFKVYEFWTIYSSDSSWKNFL